VAAADTKLSKPELAKAREDILGKVDLKKEAAGLGFGIVGGADTSLVGRIRRLFYLLW
jgi:hypothetical protein